MSHFWVAISLCLSLGAQPFTWKCIFLDNEGARKAHFYMKGCAPRLVNEQREKTTRKLPIGKFEKFRLNFSNSHLWQSSFKMIDRAIISNLRKHEKMLYLSLVEW